MMNEYIVKRGNTMVLEFLIKDKNGVIITNLATATAIKFQIKKEEKSIIPIISKTLGAGIVINAPSTGYVRVTLSSVDTTQNPALYYWGLQIEWAGGIIYEVDLKVNNIVTERMRIAQQIVI